MPWFGNSPVHKWKSYATKLDPDLREKFETYYESIKGEGTSKSGAMRILIAAGLQTVWGDDAIMVSTIQANAKAAAIDRLGVLIEEAFGLFRDPEFSIQGLSESRGRGRKKEMNEEEIPER